jgi:hypothetical protein
MYLEDIWEGLCCKNIWKFRAKWFQSPSTIVFSWASSVTSHIWMSAEYANEGDLMSPYMPVILGAPAKSRIATISFILSVRPHETIRLPVEWFSWNLKFEYFSKIFREFQVSLKSGKNNGCSTWRPAYIMIISCWVILGMKNVLDNRCRENQNTFHVEWCFSENRAVYEIIWKNTVLATETTDDNVLRSMRTACWTTKATDTHSEYVILIAFSRQQWLRERPTMLRWHVQCLTCYVP